MIIITLPYPVSANRYWQQVTINGHACSVLSKEAQQYKRDVAWLAKKAGIKPIAGRVRVGLQLYPHRPQDWAKRAQRDPNYWDSTVRCLDLDNARKVVYDSLKNIAFGDDALVYGEWGERMVPDGEGRVVVHIEPYVRALAQPELPLVPAVVDPLAPESLRAA